MTEEQQQQLLRILAIIIPAGILLLLLNETETSETNNPHTLEETDDTWLVKTQNSDAQQIDIVKLPNHVCFTFGEKQGKIVIKSIAYPKETYSKEDIEKIMKEKLVECPRCTVQGGGLT